jgi:hypothetical protein
MATSARSSAWRALDPADVPVARRIAVRLVGPARRRSLHSALLGFGAVLLVSCATNGLPPPPQTSAARVPPNRTEAAPAPGATARPPRKPAAPSPAENPVLAPDETGSGLTGPKSKGAAGSPTPLGDVAELSTSPAPPSPTPSQPELIGLDESGATRLFGPATDKSEQPPATVWHYKSANCELDLFFYLDLRSGRMRTLHYSLKSESGETKRSQDCLRSLSAAREH